MPRSGSWLLADLFERTKVAGRPREYFELPSLWTNGRFPGESYFENVRRTATTPNGVLGMKFHWHQFEYFVKSVRRNRMASTMPTALLIKEILPPIQYIWLTRRDKARQAISYFRAIHTDEWWRIRNERRRFSNAPTEIRFNFAAIERLEKLLIEGDHYWQQYFEESHLAPLVIVYEELKEDIEYIAREALDFLRISVPKKCRLNTVLAPQADKTTDQWADHYRCLKRDGSGYKP